jgi:hypothetical protein
MTVCLLNDVFFEIVDEFKVYLYELIFLEGEVGQEQVEVFNEVAEGGYLGLLLDEVDGVDDQPFLELTLRGALVE